jgi:predicted MPP superfamily phosphohydrolase
MEERIRRVLARPADLILLGGDMVHTNVAVANVVRMLGDARPPLGVFGVLGNAERKSWLDSDQVVADMSGAGVRMLMNEHVVLERNGDWLALVGVDDPYKGKPDPDAALEGCPNVFRLMLVHAPQILKWRAIGGVDLIVCGHTHGGQVRLPLVGPLMAHTLLERRWSSGFHHGAEIARAFGYDGAPELFISRGVATGFIHFRFLSPPEVHTITLRRTPPPQPSPASGGGGRSDAPRRSAG